MNRLPNVYSVSLLRQIYFWLGSILSVGLYLRTMLFINSHTGAKSNRLDTLSNVFVVIAAAWLLCEGPYVLLTLLDYPIWVISRCNDNYFQSCNAEYCGNLDTGLFVAIESTVFLKNIFPVLNTFLLVVLLRALQKPVLYCCRCLRLKRNQNTQ